MAADIRQKPEGALLRTYLTAAGIGPEAFHKPMIGVVTASSQVFSEKPDARDLGGAAINGIEASGGIAVRWDTMRSPDLMAWGHAESYSFAWRDQLADLIESWTRQQSLDGLLLVGDAPETLIGMAMAATRLNVPAIMVTCGRNRWESGQAVGADTAVKKKVISGPFELLAETLFRNKKKGEANPTVDWFRDCLLAQDNHEENAVELVLEALGVCLPGMATAPAQSAPRHALAYQSGQRLVSIIKTGPTFKRLLSSNAFANAIRLNAAMGGTVDVAIHLMALAHEAGYPLTLEHFEKISRETPQVCRLGGVGVGDAHRIEDLDTAGGVWAIMHALKDHVLPSATVNGRGASELARTSLIKDPKVIAVRKTYRKESGVGVIRGNLSMNGAVFLIGQVPVSLQRFIGPAAVFEQEVDAAKALNEGKVKKGSIIVVRSQGPKGGPGLHKLRILPALLQSRGWNSIFPLLTDGRLPDMPAGLFISLMSPESATPGPLGVLKDGDIITIDIPLRQMGLRLTDTDLRVRLARWQAPASKLTHGFLDRYSRSVSEVSEGAVLK